MASRLFVSVVIVAATALGAAFGASAASAAGCTGNVQFADAFGQADPGWPTSDNFSIGGGKFQIKPDAGKDVWSIYGASLFGDADICVDVSVSAASDPTGPGAGVVFWLADSNNYYGVYIAPNGFAAINRIQNGKVLSPVSWRKATSLKTGANAVNTIRLTLKGNAISCYFNDQLFYTIQGAQPQGGGQFGLEAWSEKANPNIWSFTNLKVTDPSQ
jgi:hypothetical protein